ncbi:DNA helicase IV [Neomoorella glycerini]|uniref:DNA helicase IV n=1 Tax=Neomoorella glycerini TaxID=55779 RepID=A0A6I5ZTN4_9FIRM|nr:UvrD-helicase domain-containing protein [Moorella glycerini]QGP93433.1 DNA helicase IV [Moorella glycerini]
MNYIYKEEAQKLREVYRDILKSIKENESRVKEKEERIREVAGYGGDMQEESQELRVQSDIIRHETKKLQQILPQPYFGRIDFQEKGEEEMETVYIGKQGYQSDGVMVIDWRAPAAAMFYSRNGRYTVNLKEGQKIIDCDLHLIRQLKTYHDHLEEVFEVLNAQNPGAAVSGTHIDQFLQKQLDRQGQERLKDVVATIQAEQNELIRISPEKNLIIQGGAGTGKTIIMLHRAAYLIYASKCRASDILVIAPNKFLLEQIAGILPDLNVEAVEQMTLYDLFLKIVEDEQKVNRLHLNPHILNPFMVPLKSRATAQEIMRYKGSEKTKEYLDYIIDSQVKVALAGAGDFLYDHKVLVPRDKVIGFYNRDALKSMPYQARREKLQNWLADIFESKSLKIKEGTKHHDIEDIKRKALEKARDYINNNLPDSSRLFWNGAVPAYLALKFFMEKQAGWQGPDLITLEDIAALIYLYLRIMGVPKHYRYILIDEAQNLCPLWLEVLKMLLAPNGSITLCGDINQKVSFGGFEENWSDALKILGEEALLGVLTNTYRTTRPILEQAKWALEKSFPDALDAMPSVLREGKAVKIREIIFNKFSTICEVISEINGYQTIGIICPTTQEAVKLSSLWSTYTKNVKEEQFKITFLPVELAGGTEFDVVIITDLDRYNRSNPEEARLLYTAITRAVHELYLLYANDFSDSKIASRSKINRFKCRQ